MGKGVNLSSLWYLGGSEYMVDGEWLNLGIIERVVMQRFVDQPNGLVLK